MKIDHEMQECDY